MTTTRFDAMLATAMSLTDHDASARAAIWRQIVDIVAQGGDRLSAEARELAFARLEHLRPHIGEGERRRSAASLAGRTRDAMIARLFAEDQPAVAAPFVARVMLSDEDWLALISDMPPATRNILRNRRDLPEAATDLLRRFAPGDLALPRPISAGDPSLETPGITPIRALVERIAAYRERVPQEPIDSRKSAVAVDRFSFETSLDGTIDWVEGVAREAIVGLSISDVAPVGEPGVDGQVAGAWRRRAPFRNARLVVAGSGEAGGDWVVEASPLFNPADGRFCGYRGGARRPQPGERAVDVGGFGGAAPDSLRQLVHELRTPLNAIQGFGEMIDQQLLGPAALRYRERAREIVTEARRLVAMVDDLDTAAQLDGGRVGPDVPDRLDLADVVEVAVATHRSVAEARGVTLSLTADAGLSPVAAARVATARMTDRLIAAALSVADAGETIAVAVSGRGSGVVCSVGRAAALRDRDERTLLDPSYGPEGDWPDAPLLGLGFTLRLVGRMAAQVGGSLSVLPDRFELALPAVLHRADGLLA